MIDASTHQMPGGKCDFCNAPNPVWVYKAERMHTVGLRGDEAVHLGELGELWAACLECHDLIQLEDLESLIIRGAEGLVQRVAQLVEESKLNPNARRMVDAPMAMNVAVAQVASMFVTFMSNRIGRPWQLKPLQ